MPENLLALRESGPPPNADERDFVGLRDDAEEGAAEPEVPNQIPKDDPLIRASMEIMYGSTFPLLNEVQKDDDWAPWARALWGRHRAGMSIRLHSVTRNRLFRKGVQWISSTGLGVWREPRKQRETARPVANMIGPALDQRVQLVTEQRPGFMVEPTNRDPSKLRKAELKQMLLEYQYDQQDMSRTLAELEYWAGTDGVAFLELYWDVDRGPWDEIGAQPQVDPSMPQQPPQQTQPLGDICHRVRRLEQVRVSAEATATKKPWYWVIRDVMPKAQALKEMGSGILEKGSPYGTWENTDTLQHLGIKNGYGVASEDELFNEQELSERLTVYCEKSEFLPQGLTLIIVDDAVVFLGPLLTGVVPVARITDGSTDPAFFPTPLMEQWIDPQMRVNAILAKWIENIRLNAGVRFIVKENALAGETLIGGVGTAISVKGLGGLSEAIKPLEGFSLAADARELMDREIRNFENISGWNDVSRGQFSADQSGRAILAIREQLERIFTPPVVAASRFMVDWAKITISFCRWGYDIPRTIGVTGQRRGDLAVEVSAVDFDGVEDVRVDPETMIPLPRSARQDMLKDYYDRGMMSMQEFRRRSPYAFVGAMQSPDDDQEARARRVVDGLKKGQVLPMLWMDDEAIHQDVLQRELILPDDTPPPIRMAAYQRWMELAMQGQMKMGGMMMQGAGAAPPAGGPEGSPLSGKPPIAGGNPSYGGTPPQVNQTDEGRAAGRFDRSSPVQ